ncbi:MAG: 4Fe-4S binding protein [Halobacteriota archaeon]|nr:4Fe-4S binding protein [Halobacteriota archaeon]
MDREEFIEKFKHVLVLVFVILTGLIYSRGVSASKMGLSDVYAKQAIESGQKKIYEECVKVGEEYIRSDPTMVYNPQGVPFIDVDRCGKKKEDYSQGDVEKLYCAAPCETYCHLYAKADAISIVTVDGGLTYQPRVDYDLCVNCGICFKNCGYHAIEWINSGEVVE